MPKTSKKSQIVRSPRVRIEFAVLITLRCNFRCSFCIVKDLLEDTELGRGPKDMDYSDFKVLINKLAKRKEKNVCMGGGEPFLHSDAALMASYAAQKLGKTHASITTNMSLFPTDPDAAKKLLKSLGEARLNMSIDREHLRHDKSLPKRIKTAIDSAESYDDLKVIAVARNSYEARHPFPKSVSRLIPMELKQNMDLRFDYYSKMHEHPKTEDLSITFLPNGRVFAILIGASPNIKAMIGDWRKDPLEKFMEWRSQAQYFGLTRFN